MSHTMQQETPNSNSNNNRYLLVKYAGLALQWIVILFLAVWGGRKMDHLFRFKKPVFGWLLPVIGIVGLLYSIIKDTSPKKSK